MVLEFQANYGEIVEETQEVCDLVVEHNEQIINMDEDFRDK